jgi:hypothetical protein
MCNPIERDFPMSTPKKNTASPVRFSVGAAEIAAADAWRDSQGAEQRSALAVYNLLFGPVDAGGHGVTLKALRKLEAGDTRSNEESAGYDFALRFFAVIFCGADNAGMLFDANVKGDVMMRRAGLKSTGLPYAEKCKRDFKMDFQGKEFPAFIKRMAAIAGDLEIEAKIAAGEAVEAEKRGADARSTDLERAVKKGAEYIKMLRKDIDKRDGSLSHETATKVAKLIGDILSSNGIK